MKTDCIMWSNYKCCCSFNLKLLSYYRGALLVSIPQVGIAISADKVDVIL